MISPKKYLKPNPTKVFTIFRKYYKNIPLEINYWNKYQILVSTLLSSKTKDETTLKASKRLFKKAPNMAELTKLKTEELEKLIYPVGFYKTKSRYLIKLADILSENKGKIPDNREGLMNLPGVGRKTANLVLNRAFNKPAIAVDTHVHKISNLLGWVRTKTPEQTERQLTKKLPKKYWFEINRLFVSIGRQFRSKNKLELFLEENKLIN